MRQRTIPPPSRLYQRMIARIADLHETLDNMTSSMENVLLHHGAAMTPTDHETRTRLVATARKLLKGDPQ